MWFITNARNLFAFTFGTMCHQQTDSAGSIPSKRIFLSVRHYPREDWHTILVGWINGKDNSNGIKNVVKYSTSFIGQKPKVFFYKCVHIYENVSQDSFKTINWSQVQSWSWSVSVSTSFTIFQFYYLFLSSQQLCHICVCFVSHLIFLKTHLSEYKLEIDVVQTCATNAVQGRSTANRGVWCGPGSIVHDL